MEYFQVNDAVIEYEVCGKGEPVLLIPVGLIADGLGRPLLAQPELASHYQIIQYHSRGYMGSTLGSTPLTISLYTRDAEALLRYLKVKSAHIVGHSIGGIIAMQLAIDAPGMVHSLALLEPPLRMVPSGKASFEGGVLPMLNAYNSGNKQQAVEIFSNNLFGPNWHSIVEQSIPGGVEQALRYIDVFVKQLSAIQAWQFGPQEAAVIHQPVLSVMGILLNNLFKREVRDLLHTWFPQTEDLDVQATHLLQMQDPVGVAQGLAKFFSRHPMIDLDG